MSQSACSQSLVPSLARCKQLSKAFFILYSALYSPPLQSHNNYISIGSVGSNLEENVSLKASLVAQRVRNQLAKTEDAGGMGLIPGSGRSPGEGNGDPFQYSCLANPMDRGPWWARVHGVAKSRTQLREEQQNSTATRAELIMDISELPKLRKVITKETNVRHLLIAESINRLSGSLLKD